MTRTSHHQQTEYWAATLSGALLPGALPKAAAIIDATEVHIAMEASLPKSSSRCPRFGA
jgi:hypothetical protein